MIFAVHTLVLYFLIVLDYVIDGLEEHIRDIIMFLIDDIKNSKKIAVEIHTSLIESTNIGKTPENMSLLNNSLITENTALDMEQKNLKNKFELHFSSEKFLRKYKYFSFLLAKNSKEKNFTNHVLYRRSLMIVSFITGKFFYIK